jgi:HTH-type transcriptional regulator / antitoxin HipB
MHIPVHSPSQLSTHLKSLRKAQKLTQTQLGARIGVKQTRIADIEKDPGAVSVAQLMQILHALDTRLLLAPPTPPATVDTARMPTADW